MNRCRLPVEQQQQHQEGAADKVSFYLKTSIFRRRVTLDADKLALGVVKQLAVAFIQELYFEPPPPVGSCLLADQIQAHLDGNQQDDLSSLYSRLLLRKYEPSSESLEPFNSVDEIARESYIVIEVSEKHLLTARAGVSMSNNPQQSSANTTTSEPAQSVDSISNSNPDVSAGSPSKLQTKSSTNPTSSPAQPSAAWLGRMSHNFKQENFLLPAFCSSCSGLHKGVFFQGFQCTHCRRNFCPKCKSQSASQADPCLGAGLAQTHGSAIGSSIATSTAAGTGVLVSGGVLPSPPATPGPIPRLETGNMNKRKSPNNLLHFNLANPFKSLHSSSNQQQQSPALEHQQTSSKSSSNRASAGALEPVLSKMRAPQQPTSNNQPTPTISMGQPTRALNTCLLSAQTGQLSSSHQNLFTGNLSSGGLSDRDKLQPASAGLNSSHGTNRNQLTSTSARNSTQDLSSGQGSSQSSSGHAFICMDWIQLSGEPTCQVCRKPLVSSNAPVRSQQQTPPYMCKICKAQVHGQCLPLAMADCMERIVDSSRAAAAKAEAGERPGSPEAQDDSHQDSTKTGVKSTGSNVSRDNIRLHRLAPSVKHVKRPDATRPLIEGWLKHTTLSREQSRRHYWRLDATDITLYENDTSTRYFKAISLDKISRVMSAQSLPKRVREDVLMSSASEESQTTTTTTTTAAAAATPAPSQANNNKSPTSRSANSSPAKSPELLAQMNAMFAFELFSGSMYLVQANSESEAAQWRQVLTAATSPIRQSEVPASSEPESKGSTGLVEPEKPAPAEPTESKQPPARKVMHERPPNQNVRQVPANQRHHHHHHHRPQQQVKTSEGQRSRLYNRPRITIQLDTSFVPRHLIQRDYLIEVDPVRGYGFKELGSGQFGKVYAAITEWKIEDKDKGIWSGIPVAIKEISKARFDLRQQEKLKNEANILSRLDHQGVIILERVHDLPSEIYIVMEQLEDDMLEMIVSTPEKKLTERVTKFLTYQILEALKYLHSKNIAHCDLKPENVLLVESRSQFPQIKLCDFGFAKIIEENSFRSSLVGTPAYLAPEVVKGERYNRSVDLWSVGVIVYVSLSGEFPFNEGETIHDQISRAYFLFPAETWSKVSQQAQNFINSLLKVSSEKRLSASRAQMDDWIQDYQLWCDLSDLEVRVGKRWVTDDADFERWSRYAKEHNLQLPRSAIQLHEELNSE